MVEGTHLVLKPEKPGAILRVRDLMEPELSVAVGFGDQPVIEEGLVDFPVTGQIHGDMGVPGRALIVGPFIGGAATVGVGLAYSTILPSR